MEALRAVEARWKDLRHDEAAAPRSMPLLEAFRAVFLNIAGFFRRAREKDPKVRGREENNKKRKRTGCDDSVGLNRAFARAFNCDSVSPTCQVVTCCSPAESTGAKEAAERTGWNRVGETGVD